MFIYDDEFGGAQFVIMDDDVVLLPGAARVLNVQPGYVGAPKTIRLPPASGYNPGAPVFMAFNTGTATFTIKDSTGTVTLGNVAVSEVAVIGLKSGNTDNDWFVFGTFPYGNPRTANYLDRVLPCDAPPPPGGSGSSGSEISGSGSSGGPTITPIANCAEFITMCSVTFRLAGWGFAYPGASEDWSHLNGTHGATVIDGSYFRARVAGHPPGDDGITSYDVDITVQCTGVGDGGVGGEYIASVRPYLSYDGSFVTDRPAEANFIRTENPNQCPHGDFAYTGPAMPKNANVGSLEIL